MTLAKGPVASAAGTEQDPGAARARRRRFEMGVSDGPYLTPPQRNPILWDIVSDQASAHPLVLVNMRVNPVIELDRPCPTFTKSVMVMRVFRVRGLGPLAHAIPKEVYAVNTFVMTSFALVSLILESSFL